MTKKTKQKIINYPLSSSELRGGFTDNTVPVIPIKKLTNFNSLGEALNTSPEGKMVLIYLHKMKPSPYGHWVGLMRDPKGRIEFFDSQGRKPDGLIENGTSPAKFNGNGILTKLINKHKGKVIYNGIPYQGEDSQLCGAFVVHRLRHQNMPLEKYQKMIKKEIDKDKQDDLELPRDIIIEDTNDLYPNGLQLP